MIRDTLAKEKAGAPPSRFGLAIPTSFLVHVRGWHVLVSRGRCIGDHVLVLLLWLYKRRYGAL